MVRLHFSLVLGLQGRRGELGAPSPRSCVLGGMQMCTLTSWEASCTNQGRMEPCGAAADENCWSWSGRRGGGVVGSLGDTERQMLSFKPG